MVEMWVAIGYGCPAIRVPAAPPPRSCHPAARLDCPKGTRGDRVAQPAPLALPHAYSAPRSRVCRRPRPEPGQGSLEPWHIASRAG